MNDRQKIGMLARQLKEALDCLDRIALWDDDSWSVIGGAFAVKARMVLCRIRGGDGRPPPKVP